MSGRFLAAALAICFAGQAIAKDITIAAIGPMTGPFAAFGTQMKVGAERAVADINASGGVNGKTIKLLIEDDACDPRQAVTVAAKVAAAGVALVAGHFCSGASIPAAKLYAEESIIQISPASTNPKLTDERAGPSIYRICGRDDQQGRVAASYVAKSFAGKRIAVLHDGSAYGKGLADQFRKHLRQTGKKTTAYVGYTAGKEDYTAVVADLKRQSIDVVFIGGYHAEIGLIVRQMREQGMTAKVVSGDALVTQDYWRLTGAAGEGTLMTFAPDPRKNPAASDIISQLRTRLLAPDADLVYVLYTYAAVQAWAQAARAATSEAAENVTAKLNTLEFNTVLGRFKFDKKGDSSLPPYKLYEWKGGRYGQID